VEYPNKSSVKSRTHKLFVALPSKRDILVTEEGWTYIHHNLATKMEADQRMQQIMDLLLARMNAMREERKADLEQMKDDGTAHRERMK
jgi:hypothetical protein